MAYANASVIMQLSWLSYIVSENQISLLIHEIVRYMTQGCRWLYRGAPGILIHMRKLCKFDHIILCINTNQCCVKKLKNKFLVGGATVIYYVLMNLRVAQSFFLMKIQCDYKWVISFSDDINFIFMNTLFDSNDHQEAH